MVTAREALIHTLHVALANERSLDLTEKAPPRVPVDLVVDHRISLPVFRAKRALELTHEDVDQLELDVASHLIAASRLIRNTADVSTALTRANIPHLVIKGVALGALQGDVASRGAGDIDLLVNAQHLPEVHRMLLEMYFSAERQLPRFESRSSWRVLVALDREVCFRRAEVDVDVHWRISPQRHLFPHTDTLISRSIRVHVDGAEVPTASPGDALAMAAFHSYHDRFAVLRGLLDIHRLIPLAAASPLPPLSEKLKTLLAGVLTLYRDLFPSLATNDLTRILSELPEPLPMVRTVWKVYGGERSSLRPIPTVRNLHAMFRAELACDYPWETLPRYVGKRLLYFPPATPTKQHTTLSRAFGQQVVRIVRGNAR